MSRRLELSFSIVILLLAAGASLAGLLVPGLYGDPAVLLPQVRGQDLVTLVVGVPLLVLGTAGVWRRSLRGRLLWLGALGYLFYTYATYAFGAVWNPLFLAYVALLGLSTYTFVLGLLATSPGDAARALAPRTPRRTAGWFLMATAVVFALLWLSDEVGALVRGDVPRSVVQMQVPTNFVHAIDLSIVLPALAITGWLLLARRPWGYLLAPVLLTKAATLGAAVLAMAWLSSRAGFGADPVLVAAFVVVTLLAASLLALTLRGGPGARRSSPIDRQ